MVRFIAQRRMTASCRDGSVARYGVGDAIPDFMDWSAHARRAHLNWGMVTREVDDTPVVAAPKPAVPAKAAWAPVVCADCDGKTFAGEKALKAHRNKHHRASV